MRSKIWKKLALATFGGAMLLQVPGCTETAINVTALMSTITAGGVMYLVGRVLD